MDIAQIGKVALGIGLQPHDLDTLQTVSRTALVYTLALVIVRLGKKRFMGHGTAFDTIVGIMLGSILSRAITSNAPLGPALGGGAMLVALHWLFSAVAVRWERFARLIRGRPTVLVRDGEPDREAMRGAHINEDDLLQDLREHGMAGFDQAAEARLECSGSVSALARKSAPRIVEITVRDGVQIVRIELA